MRVTKNSSAQCPLSVASLCIGTLGVIASLFFSFIVFPRIQYSQGAVLDPDGFGLIAQSIATKGYFTYYPGTEPTINRGPLYPALVAVTMFFSGGRYPQPAQAMQAVLFGITCALVVRLTARVGTRRAAIFAGMATAVHPFAIWYTSRIWVETPATLFFTASVLAAVALANNPSAVRASLLGVLLGLASLTKGLFLAFGVLSPLVLTLVIRPAVPLRHAAVVVLVAFCVVAPWTLRNFGVAQRLIPVHTNVGFACLLGDTFIDHFPQTGFSLSTLHRAGAREIEEVVGARSARKNAQWKEELSEDRTCIAQSFKRYKKNPLFLFKKIIFNGVLFWTLSDTPTKSLIVSAMQIPLLVLSTIAFAWIVKGRGLRTSETVPFLMATAYYLLHLPVIACARYSVVITPVLISTLAAGWTVRSRVLDKIYCSFHSRILCRARIALW